MNINFNISLSLSSSFHFRTFILFRYVTKEIYCYMPLLCLVSIRLSLPPKIDANCTLKSFFTNSIFYWSWIFNLLHQINVSFKARKERLIMSNDELKRFWVIYDTYEAPVMSGWCEYDMVFPTERDRVFCLHNNLKFHSHSWRSRGQRNVKLSEKQLLNRVPLIFTFSFVSRNLRTTTSSPINFIQCNTYNWLNANKINLNPKVAHKFCEFGALCKHTQLHKTNK